MFALSSSSLWCLCLAYRGLPFFLLKFFLVLWLGLYLQSMVAIVQCAGGVSFLSYLHCIHVVVAFSLSLFSFFHSPMTFEVRVSIVLALGFLEFSHPWVKVLLSLASKVFLYCSSCSWNWDLEFFKMVVEELEFRVFVVISMIIV